MRFGKIPSAPDRINVASRAVNDGLRTQIYNVGPHFKKRFKASKCKFPHRYSIIRPTVGFTCEMRVAIVAILLIVIYFNTITTRILNTDVVLPYR